MTEAEVTKLLELKYRASVVREDYADGKPGYVATHPELEGCMAVGSTPKEALHELDKARESYIRALVKMGIEVTTPAPVPDIEHEFQATLMWKWTFSGNPEQHPGGHGLQRAGTDLGHDVARPLQEIIGTR